MTATAPFSPPSPWPGPPLRWDVFCRVVDNFGDIGVCWRLAADLAQRGQQVRLWVDDPRALAWMAPDAPAGVSCWHWTDPAPAAEPGDVVVEAFGCDPPPGFVARMAERAATPAGAPLWLNLEYLSAEPYVERCHRLRSPQHSGPARGLDKWFFYPGFTPATGGLLRESGRVAGWDEAGPWPAALAGLRRPGERSVSLFCYPGAPLADLLDALADQPTLLLTAPGAATEASDALALPPRLRRHPLPWLSQADYDRLLAGCELNIVRGEDSFVRAQWAGRPFVWHIYPQHDGVHADKLAAFLDKHLQGAGTTLAADIRQYMLHWNRLRPAGHPPPPLPALGPWQAQVRHWRAQLLTQVDLVSQLLQFVTEKR